MDPRSVSGRSRGGGFTHKRGGMTSGAVDIGEGPSFEHVLAELPSISGLHGHITAMYSRWQKYLQVETTFEQMASFAV